MRGGDGYGDDYDGERTTNQVTIPKEVSMEL